MHRNGYFTQLLTEIAECETLEYKRRKEIEKQKKGVALIAGQVV